MSSSASAGSRRSRIRVRPAASPARPRTLRRRTLRLGVDVDVVVLAVSIGAIPLVAPDLIARDERWRHTTSAVRTVATRAAQIWLDESEVELGLARSDLTSSGWGPPFETYASMSHLLDTEEWAGARAAGLAYLCGVVPDDDTARPGRRRATSPRSSTTGWLACCPAILDRNGRRRPGVVRHTFTTSAAHPSDRYVQALPGSRAARTRSRRVRAGRPRPRRRLDPHRARRRVHRGGGHLGSSRGQRRGRSAVDEDVLGGWTTREEARR